MTTNDEKITMSDYQIKEINTPHIVCRSNYKMTVIVVINLYIAVISSQNAKNQKECG